MSVLLGLGFLFFPPCGLVASDGHGAPPFPPYWETPFATHWTTPPAFLDLSAKATLASCGTARRRCLGLNCSLSPSSVT